MAQGMPQHWRVGYSSPRDAVVRGRPFKHVNVVHSIWPVNNSEWWGAGVVICLERGAGLHMAQLMPLPLQVQ